MKCCIVVARYSRDDVPLRAFSNADDAMGWVANLTPQRLDGAVIQAVQNLASRRHWPGPTPGELEKLEPAGIVILAVHDDGSIVAIHSVEAPDPEALTESDD